MTCPECDLLHARVAELETEIATTAAARRDDFLDAVREILAAVGTEANIERLRAEADIERLRAALKQVVELDHYPDATIARKALGIFHDEPGAQK